MIETHAMLNFLVTLIETHVMLNLYNKIAH